MILFGHRCSGLVFLALFCAFIAVVWAQQLGKQATIRYPKIKGERYGANVIRKWHLKAGAGVCIEFMLKGLNMERSAGCTNDYLDVYDGKLESAPRKLHTCGEPTSMPPAVRSTRNQMMVVFYSDSNEETGVGFQALVKTVACGSASPQQQQQQQQQQQRPQVPSGQSSPITGENFKFLKIY